jgi:hypothetical protein
MVLLTRFAWASQETVPPVDKNGLFEMRHVQRAAAGQQWPPAGVPPNATHVWELLRDGAHVRFYDEAELRLTLVWRQHCFASAWEVAQFEAKPERLELESVLSTFRADLARRGKAVPDDPLEFATLLAKEYIAYPLPSVPLPYNYCVAPLALPADAFYQPALRWLLSAVGCN